MMTSPAFTTLVCTNCRQASVLFSGVIAKARSEYKRFTARLMWGREWKPTIKPRCLINQALCSKNWLFLDV